MCALRKCSLPAPAVLIGSHRRRMLSAGIFAAAVLFAQASGPAAAVGRSGAGSPNLQIATVKAAASPGVVRRPSSSVDVRYQSALKAGKVPLVYVAEYEAGAVLAYPSNTSTVPTAPVETIDGLANPQGLAVDANGNLYVAEQGANDVKVFKPGSTTPFKTLTGASGANSAAIDTRGTLYVATGTGTVIVYVNGATTPSYTLSDRTVTNILNIAVDGIGNLIVTYIGPATGIDGGVGAFPAFTSLGLTLGARGFVPLSVDAPTSAKPSPTPGGVAIDKYGDLLVGDRNLANVNIGVYHPATQAPKFFIGAATPGQQAVFALTGPDNHHIFAAPVFGDTLDEFGYPSGNLQEQITLGFGHSAFVTAVATYPAPPVGAW